MDNELRLSTLHNLSKDKNRSWILPPNIDEVTKLGELIADRYSVKPIPFSKLSEFSNNSIQFVMYAMGLYTFPTIEVIDFLKSNIEDDLDDSLEIGAGLGWIGKSLGIKVTDSKLQSRPDIMELYDEVGQPTINYPDFVERLDANKAILKYRPKYVIGSYITSKKFNIYGVDNMWVANNCRKYFMIGNLNIHSKDPVMKRRFKTEIKLPGLVTRGDSSKARIWIFESKCFNNYD